MFCQVEPEQVLAVHDVASTYYVPDVLKKQGLITSLAKILHLERLKISPELVLKGANTWEIWRSSTSQEDLGERVDIALVGKYTNAADSYISVIKVLEHAAMACRRRLKLHLIESSHLEESSRDAQPERYQQAWHTIRTANGILVPGGFGTRGTEGMIAATKWARENEIPFLGVCLGMQIAVIEYARNVCYLSDANSVERKYSVLCALSHPANSPDLVDEKMIHPVVISMPEIDQEKLGGTMRLGMRPTHFQPGSKWSNIQKTYSTSRPTCPSSSHFASQHENEPSHSPSNPRKVAAAAQGYRI